MGLRLTITKKGVTYNDAYLRVGFDHRDKANKVNNVYLFIYPNHVYAGTNPKDPLFGISVGSINDRDFDTFFSVSVLNNDTVSPESKAYEFLKTIDPEEFEAPYPNFPYDLKNDSFDSLATADRDSIFRSPLEGDKYYDETLDKYQTYTASVWGD